MGRKKGGKNPEGHRAGGARSGAGRPRKAGPLTLKASIRVHAHDPALFVRRDAIHPTLRELIDTPAHYLLRCAECGIGDTSCQLVAIPVSNPDASNPLPSSLSSRSTTPPSEYSESAVQVPYLDHDPRHEARVLCTPPLSVSPDQSQQHEPRDMPMDESAVAHAESLLLLRAPAPNAAQTSFDMSAQPDGASQPPHANIQDLAQTAQPRLVQPSPHLERGITYDSTCHFTRYLPGQTAAEPYQDQNTPVPNEYPIYHPMPAEPDEPFRPSSGPNFSLGSASPVQTRPQSFSHSPALYPPQPVEYEQQPNEYTQTFYTQPYQPDLYLEPQLQPHRPTALKSGLAAWRHAPHSSSLAPPVAAIISPHSAPAPVSLDTSGPVQFLPTGQHSQRRRRRCVICINAGRNEDADRCCGRGNRHLCPWYSRHGSPENIMDIRNPKDTRLPNANLA